MSRTPTDTRARILRAAEDVVIRDGVGKLTLDAAAHEAGISKGGILYHFPSRGALVSAMVEGFVVSFDDDLAAYGALDGSPGAFTRAYLQATLTPRDGEGPSAAGPERGQEHDDEHEADSEEHNRRLGAALLAGVASDPELLAPLRDRFSAWQEAVEADGIPADVATVVRLCADAIWLADLLELAPVHGELREAVGRLLASMVAPAERPPAGPAEGAGK